MGNSLITNEQRIRNLTVSLQQISDEFDKVSTSFSNSLIKEKFLSDADLSTLLHIDRRTLKRYRQAGKIPYYKLNGKIIYKESEIYKLLEDNFHPAYAL
ncbi:MAG: helix-turn-helix domain-containing protein [Dysgonomonas mossii]|uniref:helix-turn-helix domain-containing protein n=1 Tax=Dysgonomonas mossii TaxID=163665 RepID=UPI003995DD7B